MKQATNKIKMITMGLITLSTMALTSSVMATGIKEKPVEIKFMGTFKNHPTFQVNLNNEEAENFIIKIKDGDNNLLFSEKAKGMYVSRNYQLEIDEAEFHAANFKLVVEVTSLKSKTTEFYSISTNTRVIEDVIIAKL